MSRHHATLVLLAVFLLSVASALRPGTRQGYEPSQPIEFSHRLHAGELAMDCQFCHVGSEVSRHAGIPSADSCMACHAFITNAIASREASPSPDPAEPRTVSRELQKLYHALGLDAELQPSSETVPLAWTRVHSLPDFVYFDHRSHVSVGVQCQVCHGAVESMDRVRQASPLTMGWCVDCHRETNRTGVLGKTTFASLDCVACHY